MYIFPDENSHESIIDKYQKYIPEYYPTMYLDGYTPEQIMIAMRKKMRGLTRPAPQEPPFEVHITSEVKLK